MLILSGCDPGVQIAWDEQFNGVVDDRCIEKALKSVAPDVKRGGYVSEGDQNFPPGTEVIQFSYSDPTRLGFYTLNVARLSTGKTNYHHEWAKLGTRIPPEDRDKVVPLLNRANEAVARQCGLSFAEAQPR